jgi:hypothetical protein
LLIGQVLCFHVWIGSAYGADKKLSTGIDVKVSQGEVTLDARNAQLAQVLQEIAAKANLQLTLRGDLSAPVTQSFAGVPLEEAITRLAQGFSFALTYAAATGDRGAEIVTGLWVVGSPVPSAPFTEINVTPAASSAISRASEPNDTPSLHPTPSPLANWVGEIQTLTEEARRGNRAAISHLGDIIATEPNADVRARAVAALAGLKGAEVEALLTRSLEDAEASVRVRAVRGVRLLGNSGAAQSLSQVMGGDPDPRVRAAALSALSSLPSRASLQAIEKASADPNSSIRDTAARALSWWRTRLQYP